MVLDDEDSYLRLCQRDLAPRRVVGVHLREEAMALMSADRFDLVLVDLFLELAPGTEPSSIDAAFAWGIDIVADMRAAYPEALIVLVSGGASLAFAEAARAAGANATVPKQFFSPHKVVSLIEAGRLGELEQSCLPRQPQTLAQHEWEFVTRTYMETGRNIQLTAERLAISRSSVYRKLSKRVTIAPPRGPSTSIRTSKPQRG